MYLLSLILTSNENEERLTKFKSTVMLTGVNESKKETKFVSGAYKLVEGKHLNSKDKHQILMHKDLAKKNHLKVGDKLLLRSNIYDADNEKGADETVEVTIKGLFDGHNQGGVTAAQELYENNLITDLDTAAKVYGNRIYALSINALRRFREQQFWQAGNTCRALCQN